MSADFELIQHDIAAAMMKALSPRQRNQFVGCMHAHNELAVLTRLLMFSLNDVGQGELHDAAHGVQMWCIMQLLVGTLYETWNMLKERFLRANPEDPSLTALTDEQRQSLAWLKNYFGEDKKTDNPLSTIRDKTAFHYDKLNLEKAMQETDDEAHRVYIAKHPVNGLYYAGSALVFEAVFGMITDQSTTGTANMTSKERMERGVKIVLRDVDSANLHMHNLLYGIIYGFLKPSLDAERQQVRVPIQNAPAPTQIAIPMFVDIPERVANSGDSDASQSQALEGVEHSGT
jgi:hypothetical protein